MVWVLFCSIQDTNSVDRIKYEITKPKCIVMKHIGQMKMLTLWWC